MCVITMMRVIKCIGDNTYNQLEVPASASMIGLAAYKINSGWQHNCIEKNDGGIVCWGRNDKGQSDFKVMHDLYDYKLVDGKL